MFSSQKRFICQERIPMLVGLPTAMPSHQITSSGVASATPGNTAAPSAVTRHASPMDTPQGRG